MDVKNEVKRIEKIINASTAIDMNKQRHLVKVVCNPDIIDSLKTDDIPYLGKMQRQIAKAFVNADENGKKLEVWLKEVDKHEQETITPTMPAVVPSAEESQDQQLVQDSEECASTPTHSGKWSLDANPTIAQPMEEKEATAGHLEELIIARVWKNFKEINPTCKEERGSEFFHSWKQDLLASDPLLRYIVSARGSSKFKVSNPNSSKPVIESIDGPWPDMQELKKIFEDLDASESEVDGFNELSPFTTSKGPLSTNEVRGVINEGKWLRIKNGMTMDSGASVFVMPSSWLDMFELRESAGSRRGQLYVAAAKDGKPIRNEEEKVIKFYTKPSLKAARRKLTFQVAAVNKMLASVAGFCDANNEVIFRKRNGIIRELTTGEITPFRRHGNIYVLDAYIPNPDYVDKDGMEVDEPAEGGFSRPGMSSGFSRQGAR